MKRLLILLAALLVWTSSLKSQGDLDEQQKIFFRNEYSFGVQLNSDGVGFGYRIANRTNYLNKNILEFELGTIKHPKEYKLTSYEGRSFVYGKKNFPMYFRASIGRQRELYPKADLGGVSIRFLYSAGPTLAVYKPVYYRVEYLTPIINRYGELEWVLIYEDEKFGASSQPIVGKSSFFKGFDEVKVIPGVFAKMAFAFEYSKDDKIIHAVEVGANVNAYLKEIPIMATNDNKSIFLSLFVSYRFGIVVDPFSPDSRKVKNMFRGNKIDN